MLQQVSNGLVMPELRMSVAKITSFCFSKEIWRLTLCSTGAEAALVPECLHTARRCRVEAVSVRDLHGTLQYAICPFLLTYPRGGRPALDSISWEMRVSSSHARVVQELHTSLSSSSSSPKILKAQRSESEHTRTDPHYLCSARSRP